MKQCSKLCDEEEQLCIIQKMTKAYSTMIFHNCFRL